ncbi:unnamed protein product [Calypogeia fissa]
MAEGATKPSRNDVPNALPSSEPVTLASTIRMHEMECGGNLNCLADIQVDSTLNFTGTDAVYVSFAEFVLQLCKQSSLVSPICNLIRGHERVKFAVIFVDHPHSIRDLNSDELCMCLVYRCEDTIDRIKAALPALTAFLPPAVQLQVVIRDKEIYNKFTTEYGETILHSVSNAKLHFAFDAQSVVLWLFPVMTVVL